MKLRWFFFLLSLSFLSACEPLSEQFGLESPAQKTKRLEDEGKAVGNACRHGGRPLEDCYTIYSWLPRAGIITGWREMDEYMRKNNITTIAPMLPPPDPPGTKRKKKPTAEESVAEENKSPPADTADSKKTAAH